LIKISIYVLVCAVVLKNYIYTCGMCFIIISAEYLERAGRKLAEEQISADTHTHTHTNTHAHTPSFFWLHEHCWNDLETKYARVLHKKGGITAKRWRNVKVSTPHMTD